MKTIVSVTPTRLETDSRSFKIAASVARFGYTSILIEGKRSKLDKRGLPFAVRSLEDLLRRGNALPNGSVEESASHSGIGVAIKIWMTTIDSTLLFPFLFLLWYAYHYVLLPLSQTPRASLYYLHGYALYPSVWILSKRYNAPIVYDAHDFYSGIKSPEEIAALGFGRRWLMTFYRNLESRLVKNASAVVTVAERIAGLQERTFGRRPIVIRNSHDHRIDRNPPNTLRASLGLSRDHFLLVVVGNCKQGMAIREALDAMLELPDRVHLAFVGSFYEEHLGEIRRRMLDRRVHIVGPARPDELVPFIADADASLLLYYPRSANYRNCLPNGFFQAIAAGLPLFYPRLPEIAEIAGRYEIGTPIDPLVPSSVSSAVTRLMNDPVRMGKYGRNLRTAVQDLTWDREELVLKELISRALAQSKR
jgi:glycosyltransferase involved in cell wall biosynthesis